MVELKPVTFDGKGEARLTEWKKQTDSGEALFSKENIDGRKALRIEVSANEEQVACLASFRSRVMLNPGLYRFQGKMKTAGVKAPAKSVRGAGAGLRVSMQRRQNSLIGDQDWQEIQFDFVIRESEQTVQLICDLRAQEGRVWFESESLKLVRLGDPPPIENRPQAKDEK